MNSAMSLNVEKVKHGFPKILKFEKNLKYFFSNFRNLSSVCLKLKKKLRPIRIEALSVRIIPTYPDNWFKGFFPDEGH